MQTKTLLIFTLALTTLSAQAQMEHPDACTPVFKACAAQGFMRDEQATPGKKMWGDCAHPIIFENKSVAGVAVDAKVAAKCKKYKIAKDQFEKDWNQKHQND
jgi:hypothetical protein